MAVETREGALGGEKAKLASVAGDDAGGAVMNFDDEGVGATTGARLFCMNGHGGSFAAARRSSFDLGCCCVRASATGAGRRGDAAAHQAPVRPRPAKMHLIHSTSFKSSEAKFE